MVVTAQSTSSAAPGLPVVLLIGDSIRLGYAPTVTQRLAGRMEVVSPAANGGDSANMLRHLEEWVTAARPDLVHCNCGLHDLKLTEGRYQVPPEDYGANLREIVRRLRATTAATLEPPNLAPRNPRRLNQRARHLVDLWPAWSALRVGQRRRARSRGQRTSVVGETIRPARRSGRSTPTSASNTPGLPAGKT